MQRPRVLVDHHTREEEEVGPDRTGKRGKFADKY